MFKIFEKIIIIFFLVTIFIYEIFIFSSKPLIADMKKEKIFTFWEPSEKMPGYIRLCIDTWKKFLPKHKIYILDYKKAKDFLGEELFNSIICKNMTLPIQADAIRVALLKKYGGIWMDADIILLNGEFLKELKGFELVMIGDNISKTQNIGFIYSTKNSSIINEWLSSIIKNVQIYKKNIIDINHANNAILRKMKSWNYLGNAIVDKLLKNVSDKKFFRLDRRKINALPENRFFMNSKLNLIQRYQQYYFQKRDFRFILNNSKNLILLHNSWTPFKYKTLSKNQFLKQDILLARLLQYILKK